VLEFVVTWISFFSASMEAFEKPFPFSPHRNCEIPHVSAVRWKKKALALLPLSDISVIQFYEYYNIHI
jgi:hypothetical protein